MHTLRSARVWIVTGLIALSTTMVGTASQDRGAEQSERRNPAITGSWGNICASWRFSVQGSRNVRRGWCVDKQRSRCRDHGAAISCVLHPGPGPVDTSGRAHLQHHRRVNRIGCDRRPSPVFTQGSANGDPQ